MSRLIWSTNQAIKQATGIAILTLVQEESSARFYLRFDPRSQRLVERYGRPSLEKIRLTIGIVASEVAWDAILASSD